MQNYKTMLFLILCVMQPFFMVASCQKICSTKCSIRKNTWLPRSFASYQFHELIAQKKRIQDRQKQERDDEFSGQVLLTFDHDDHFLSQVDNSVHQEAENQDVILFEKLENSQLKSDAVEHSEKITVDNKKKSQDDELDIFDQEKDYILAPSSLDEPKKNRSYLVDFTKRVQQKTSDFFSYWKNDTKKTIEKNGSLEHQIPQPKKHSNNSQLELYKKDYLDMQELAEEIRTEIEDVKEQTKKQLFYEKNCRNALKYNSLHTSFFMDYMHNFGGKCGQHCKNLGSMPFWTGTNIMTVGRNDGRADLDAYQLGMGNINVNKDGIGGVIQLNPEVEHVGADVYLHWVHKLEQPGLYFKMHIPFGSLIIYPNFTELKQAFTDDSIDFTQTTLNPGSTNINYQFVEYPTPFFRPTSVSEAFFGGSASPTHFNGNRHHPLRLRKGRISLLRQSEVRFGDITVALGYNVVANPKGFFGVAFKLSCPTGNVPLADFMLESIFGRAGLWGVGADISGFYNVWSNAAGNKSLNFAVQGELLHLMQGRTPNFRTFDLKLNGPGSKYLIIQKYTAIYQHATPGFITVEGIDSRTIQPAANITTVPVVSNIGLEGSLGVMFDFSSDNWNFDFGVEFWGRSPEKLQIDTRSSVAFRLTNFNNYAVLGRQVSSYLIDGQPNRVLTYYCEPLARIGESKDAVQLIGSPPGVTAPLYTNLPEGIVDARISSNRIPTLLDEALDIAGAQASSIFTGKIFSQVGYTWTQRCYIPSLSVVAGAEFTDNTNNGIQLWSIGLRGSLQF